MTKMLVAATVAAGACAGLPVSAYATPDSPNSDQNAFGGLACSCRESTPGNNVALSAELARGIGAGTGHATG